MKAEKKFYSVIHGLHPVIKEDLAGLDNFASDVSNIQIKKKSSPRDKNSECTWIKLPLFFVDLNPQVNNKDIYNLDR